MDGCGPSDQKIKIIPQPLRVDRVIIKQFDHQRPRAEANFRGQIESLWRASERAAFSGIRRRLCLIEQDEFPIRQEEDARRFIFRSSYVCVYMLKMHIRIL